VLISAITLNAHAQNSNLQIATASEIAADRTGEFRFTGIEFSIATLRKTVVNAALNQLTPEQLRNPVGSTKEITPKEKIAEQPAVNETGSKEITMLEKDKKTVATAEVKQNKQINTFSVPATTTITSATIYDIAGATAIPSRQYTSLQAAFKFLFYNGTTRMASSPAGIIELYKLEKSTSSRSFCIPSGGCASVNIPIQITVNGQPVMPDAGIIDARAGAGKSPLYMVVLPNGGYLQPGEYAFIDKSSLSRDGSALKCFAFTVRQ
jgi:hypothetical protein